LGERLDKEALRVVVTVNAMSEHAIDSTRQALTCGLANGFCGRILHITKDAPMRDITAETIPAMWIISEGTPPWETPSGLCVTSLASPMANQYDAKGTTMRHAPLCEQIELTNLTLKI